MALKQKKEQKAAIHLPFHVKKGDTVMVISGKDKGKTGIVKRVFTDRAKVLVEGLNIIKKAVKPNPMLGQQGGIVEMESPIHVSKVMLYSLKASKPTRIQKTTIETASGKKRRVRVCKHTQEQLD